MLSRSFKKSSLKPTSIISRTSITESARDFPNNFDYTDRYFEVEDKTGIIVTPRHQKGNLNQLLKILDKFHIKFSRIESKPSQFSQNRNAFDFHIDFYGNMEDPTVGAAIAELEEAAMNLKISNTPSVPWFPTYISDIDKIGKEAYERNYDVHDQNHPRLEDTEYLKRRKQISKVALDYHMSDPQIPVVDYSKNEVDVWKHCYSKQKKLYEDSFCKEYNEALEQVSKHCGFAEDSIPQLNDTSEYLKETTGWRLRPINKQLSQREFLNSLAFKVFHSPQYIRHPSNPNFTSDPDAIHWLMGNIPMLANNEFASFLQLIGVASLGVPDAYIPKLAALYWFSAEFGMCKEEGKRKSYGAGLVSNSKEFEWSLSGGPNYYPFYCDDITDNHHDFQKDTVQPYYFVSESFKDCLNKVAEYTERIPRQFNCFFNEKKQTIEVDRKIKGIFD